MEEKELISKKELLTLTGISYGQLYRWKRENLIPESWFIKKSSFTGQETFFPKDKILKRTNAILELKDKYSLEELADILSPKATNRVYDIKDVKELHEISEEVVSTYSRILEKEHFNFVELTFIYMASRLKTEISLQQDELEEMAQSLKGWLPNIKDSFNRYIICRKDDKVFTLLVQQDTGVLTDSGTKEVKTVYMDELSKDLKLLLNDELEG